MKPERHVFHQDIPGVKRCPHCHLLSPIQAPTCVCCGHQYRGNLPYMPVSDRTQVLWFPMDQFPPPQTALPVPPVSSHAALPAQKSLPVPPLPALTPLTASAQYPPPHVFIRVLRMPLFLTARLFLMARRLGAAALRLRQ